MKAPHHRGTYHVRSRRLTAAARANPYTRCWRPDCRLTLAESKAKWGEHVHWQAGHTGRGDELLPECSHCNASHGARDGNARRGGTDLTW